MADIVKRDDLTITETLCGSLWQVTAWPDTASATAGMLPAQPGPSEIAGGIARIGPLVWVGFDGSPPEVTPEQGTALDLGHSRKRFRVEGELALDVMMRLAPLDFRDAAFADQTIKATSAHHTSVWIARDGAAWDIYVGHTFSDAFREVLEHTAGQWEAV